MKQHPIDRSYSREGEVEESPSSAGRFRLFASEGSAPRLPDEEGP